METALRILDANANRVREALRTIEDIVRFQLEDRVWSAVLKELRHEFTAAMAEIPTLELLTARDTPGDVGTQISTPAEGMRLDEYAILAAAFKRVQEALRSMEEQAKTLNIKKGSMNPPTGDVEPDAANQKCGCRGETPWKLKDTKSNIVQAGGKLVLAGQLEALRYRVYDLEAKLIGRMHRAGRFNRVRLYVLFTSALCKKPWQEVACAVLKGGVDAVQLREKEALTDQELLARSRWWKERCRETGKLFIVNDRPDIVALVKADGVHLGQEDLPVPAARKIVGGASLIGVSTHNLEQARQAVRDGADYLGVGPLFPTVTKPEAVGRWGIPGPELLRQALEEIPLPLAAIGGITAENAGALQPMGGYCLAVSSAVLAADDPAAAVQNILGQLNPKS